MFVAHSYSEVEIILRRSKWCFPDIFQKTKFELQLETSLVVRESSEKLVFSSSKTKNTH